MALVVKDAQSDLNVVGIKLRRYQGMHSRHQAERNAIAAELDRLRSARKSLERAIADFASYRKRAGSALDKIPQGQFRGDRRNRTARAMERFSREIDKEAEAHQENRATIDHKIRELEEKGSGLDATLRNLTGTISSLERQLRQNRN